jgi:hypothetical protein
VQPERTCKISKMIWASAASRSIRTACRSRRVCRIGAGAGIIGVSQSISPAPAWMHDRVRQPQAGVGNPFCFDSGFDALARLPRAPTSC